jgi:hypothetical protein
VPMDCCHAYAGDDDCMGMLGTYPWNFTCEDGVCVFNGCTSDQDCTFGGVLEGYGCLPGDNGIGVCQPLCTVDSDCDAAGLPGWVCDNGVYCAPPPCVDDESCGPGLVCDPTTTTCIAACSDESCADFGVCDPESNSCVCTDSAQCLEGWRCAP